MHYTEGSACMQCCGDHCRTVASELLGQTASLVFPMAVACAHARVRVCTSAAAKVTHPTPDTLGNAALCVGCWRSWHNRMACFAAQVRIHRMPGVYPVHAVATGTADLKWRSAVTRVAAGVAFVFHSDDRSRVEIMTNHAIFIGY